LMFLVISHAVFYSALQMDAMRAPTSGHTISRSSSQGMGHNSAWQQQATTLTFSP
jgi:hypothetical protein